MTSPVQSVRILVVDDDAGICDLLETVLKRDGYEVRTLSDPTTVDTEVSHSFAGLFGFGAANAAQ